MRRARWLLAGLLQLLVGGVVLAGSTAGYRYFLEPAITSAFGLSAPAATLVRRLGVFVIAAASYGVFVRVYERRPVRELGIRWGWTLLAAIAGSLSIGVTILVLCATGHVRLVSYHGFGPAWGVLAQIGVAAMLEELAFRALLFRILEERLGSRAALAVSALVFGLAHVSNVGFSPISLISVPLAGLMWAGVFVVSRNVWVTAVHHACWNATIFLSGMSLSGELDWRARAPLQCVTRGSTLWSGGDFGPENSLVNIVVSVSLCFALWRLARRMDPGFPHGPGDYPASDSKYVLA